MPAILILIVLLAAGHTKASKACERKLDILFLVDSSYNVCNSTETCPTWSSVLQFIKNIVSSFTIGPNDTKVAFVTVSDDFTEEWNLNGYSDKTSLLSAIGNVSYTAGEFTKLHMLSTLVVPHIFKPEILRGAERSNALNVAIMITNGYPDIDSATGAIVSTGYQKTYFIAAFAVCVMPGCTENWARGFSSPPKKANETYFLVDSYFSLDSVTDNLVKKLCSHELSLIPGLVPRNYK